MSIPSELPSAVRQGISKKPMALLGLVVFVITVLAIHLWGQIRSQIETAKTEPVTAIVEQSPPICLSPEKDLHPLLVSKTVELIKDQVTAHDLLRQVYGDVNSQASDADVEKLRRALQVEIDGSPLGGKCLRLRLVWPKAHEAVKLLNVLGERYANQYRAAWSNENESEYRAAKTAAEHAGQGFDEAIAQLEFFQQCLDFVQQGESESPAELTREIRQPPTPPGQSAAENAAQPLRDDSDIENPAWISMQKDLVELRNKEAKLLEKRTPLHPEVRFLQEQIRDCEMRIAATSRWIHAAGDLRPVEEIGAYSPLPSITAPEAKVRNDQSRTNNAELLAELENQVQAAGQAYRAAVARERTVFGQRKAAPEITVRVREPRKIAAISKTPAPRLFGWLAGVIMAVGVGLICTGKAIEPPVGSIDELQRLADVPIVGVVPSYNPTVDPQVVKRTKKLLRFGLFLSGLIIMTGCIWVIVRLM